MVKRKADLEIARVETLVNYEVTDAPLSEVNEDEADKISTIQFTTSAQSATSVSTVVSTPNSPRKVLYVFLCYFFVSFFCV